MAAGKPADLSILLIAYEFPPLVSAQSIRWFYLCNELAQQACEVHVVAPQWHVIAGEGLELDPRIKVHRVFPGPYAGSVHKLSKLLRRKVGPPAKANADTVPRGRWAGRLNAKMRLFLDWLLFPDSRTEWVPFAVRAASRLCRTTHIDCLIASHEPAASAIAGIRVKQRTGIPLVVDLGDPIDAPYIHGPGKRFLPQLEAWVCEQADRILVTNEKLAEHFVSRHSISPQKFCVVTQGFQSNRPDRTRSPDRHTMRLIYTGNFYRDFRDPTPLLDAFLELNRSDMELIIAGNAGEIVSADRFRQGGVRFLGPVTHQEAIELQDSADVLISVGNTLPHQIPGKLYEYLGATGVILHIAGPDDPAGEIASGWDCAVVIGSEKSEIGRALSELHLEWQRGTLSRPRSKRHYAEAHSWSALAGKVRSVVEADVLNLRTGTTAERSVSDRRPELTGK